MGGASPPVNNVAYCSRASSRNSGGRTRDAAGDHDQIGIVDVTDHGQTHGQPTGELGDRCQREWVTVLRGVGDPATGERTRIHRYLTRQDRRRGRVGGKQFDCRVDERRSAAIALPTPTFATRALTPARNDLDVAQFGSDAVTPPRYSSPLISSAPPIPVPIATITTLRPPAAAPNRCSANAAALASCSRTTGKPSRLLKSLPTGASTHGKCGANRTELRSEVMKPATANPTADTSCW